MKKIFYILIFYNGWFLVRNYPGAFLGYVFIANIILGILLSIPNTFFKKTVNPKFQSAFEIYFSLAPIFVYFLTPDSDKMIYFKIIQALWVVFF